MQSQLVPRSAATTECRLEDFTAAIRAASRWLELNRDRLNALNVFPVPDGDTGDNMALTMRGGVQALDELEPTDLAGVCDALSEGTLNGSRGNSGVILSQMIAGFAQELRRAREVTPETLARAFSKGAEAGYRAHSEPVEGTMMTVARDLAEEARRGAEAGAPLQETLRATLEAARLSVVRTREILPRLRQAGVVDAGGEGLAVLLEGALRHLSGEPLDAVAEPVESAHFDELEIPEDDIFGYCTNFLVRGQGLDVDEFREKVLSVGRSALVVGNEHLVKVHVHTLEPGELLTYALSKGTLHQIKLDNMDDQYESVRHAHPERVPAEVVTGLVAVAAGEGFERLLRNDAHAIVVRGGQGRNPSTGDLAEAIGRSPAEDVIVLPNNPNVIMAAEQAARTSPKHARVLPTRSLPVGVIAALAYNPEFGPDANYEAMASAVEGVRAIELARAVRDAEVDGLGVREGEFMAVLDGTVVRSGGDPAEVFVAALEEAGAGERELLTLFRGEDVSPEDAERLSEAVEAAFHDLEVDLHEGGQPHYPFVASLE